MIQITTMPWSSFERNLLFKILKTGGVLRESKPPITDRESSYAAYVWRMLQFCLSDNPKLQCMPVMCYYDLLCGSESERTMVSRELDNFVDRVLATIPIHEWHGILRWALAFGCVPTRADVTAHPDIEKES